MACYRYYNIVLGGEGAANIKSQEFLHLIVGCLINDCCKRHLTVNGTFWDIKLKLDQILNFIQKRPSDLGYNGNPLEKFKMEEDKKMPI